MNEKGAKCLEEKKKKDSLPENTREKEKEKTLTKEQIRKKN